MLKNKAKKLVILAVSLAVLLPPLWAAMTIYNKADASAISDLRNQIANQQAMIANNTHRQVEINQQIANARAAQQARLLRKEWYDQLIMNTQEQIDLQAGLIGSIEELLTLTAERLEEAQADYDRSYQLFLELLQFTYRRGPAGHLELFLRADNLSALLTQIDRMAEMANYTRDILNSLENDRQDIAMMRETYAETGENHEREIVRLNELTEDFNRRQNEVDAYIRSLEMTIEQAEAEQRRMDAEDQELEETIRRMTAEIQAQERAAAAAAAEAARVAGRQAAPVLRGGTYVGGQMAWPVASRFTWISSPFGNRRSPITGRSEFHRGVDIAGSGISGTNIYAANDGIVIISQFSGSLGNHVVIDHGGGVTTLYGHALRRLVSVGDSVTRGQAIATVGSTGASTGPHLHFEVAVNGTREDPIQAQWIGRR